MFELSSGLMTNEVESFRWVGEAAMEPDRNGGGGRPARGADKPPVGEPASKFPLPGESQVIEGIQSDRQHRHCNTDR